jgi:hypothetical protein
MYQSFILPLLEYGSIIFALANQNRLAKLGQLWYGSPGDFSQGIEGRRLRTTLVIEPSIFVEGDLA